MKLLKFGASWCAPCKALSKTIAELPADVKSLVEEIDIDLSPGITQSHGIRSVPTLVLVDGMGKELRRTSGAVSTKQLMEFIDYGKV